MIKEICAAFTLVIVGATSCGIPLTLSSQNNHKQLEINENITIEQLEESVSLEEIIEEPEIDINSLPSEQMYTTTRVHLRAGPSTDTEIIDTLELNTEIDKIGEEGDWTIVRRNNEKYYIYSKYISNEKTIVEVSRSSSLRTTQTEIKETPATSAAFLGYYTLTYYCSCSKCCGSYANGITAWGTTAVAGKTIAAPTNLKLGTKVIINGHTYVVEDRGSAIKGNKIDVYVNSHSEALALGISKNVPVYLAE